MVRGVVLKSILKKLRKEGSLPELGKQAREIAKKYSWEAIIKKYIQIIQQVIAAKK